MNLNKFRKEFSGAPYGVKEFAEVVLTHLREPKTTQKATADTIAANALRDAADQYFAAEQHFAMLLQKYRIDIG
jgi:hypothetical protein